MQAQDGHRFQEGLRTLKLGRVGRQRLALPALYTKSAGDYQVEGMGAVAPAGTRPGNGGRRLGCWAGPVGVRDGQGLG